MTFAPESVAENTAPLRKRTFRRDKMSSWVFLDQSFVSLGSFTSNILIARGTSPGTYGAFALTLAAIIVLNSLHSALIAYPLSIGISTQAQSEHRNSTVVSALLLTFIACACIAAIVIPGLSMLEGIRLSALSVLALFAWQAQEICRRTLMAMSDTSRIIVGDFFSYPGQTVMIYAVMRYQHHLTLGAVFSCMAATSLLGCAIQLIQIRPPLALRDFPRHVKRFWILGSWGGLGALLNMVASQTFIAALGMRFGAPAAASMQSLSNIVNVANPVTLGMTNAVVPRVATENTRSGIHTAAKAGIDIGMRGALLVGPYLLFVMLAPTVMLNAFYGHKSAYLTLGAPLRLMAFAYGLYYAGALIGSVLNGLSQPRLALRGVSLSTAFSMAFALPLAITLGVAGAAVGAVLVAAARLVAQALALAGFSRVSKAPQNCLAEQVPA